jgi:UPF0755 protein
VAPTPPSSSAPPPDPAPRLRRWKLGVTLAAAIIAGAGGYGGARWFNQALNAPGPLIEAKAIVIPRGGTARLADDLAASNVLNQPLVFRAAVWLTRQEGTLRAAEFLFPQHASIRQVITILRTARPVEHHVTIPEGLTAQQITTILAHAEAATGEITVSEEGTLLPQTYTYERGTDRASLVARAKASMDKDLAAAWTDRAPGLPLLTPREALILASIVERETARPEERPHVAAVYLNRLRQGMKLQADPTVVYLASGGAGVLDHGLTRA